MKTGGGKNQKTRQRFSSIGKQAVRTEINRGGTTNEERCITAPQLTPGEGFQAEVQGRGTWTEAVGLPVFSTNVGFPSRSIE